MLMITGYSFRCLGAGLRHKQRGCSFAFSVTSRGRDRVPWTHFCQREVRSDGSHELLKVLADKQGMRHALFVREESPAAPLRYVFHIILPQSMCTRCIRIADMCRQTNQGVTVSPLHFIATNQRIPFFPDDQWTDIDDACLAAPFPNVITCRRTGCYAYPCVRTCSCQAPTVLDPP